MLTKAHGNDSGGCLVRNEIKIWFMGKIEKTSMEGVIISNNIFCYEEMWRKSRNSGDNYEEDFVFNILDRKQLNKCFTMVFFYQII